MPISSKRSDHENPLDALKKRIKEQRVIRDLQGRHFSGDVYLVGGAIRELYLCNTPKDYDLILSAHKDLSIIEDLFGVGAFVLGKKHIQTYRLVNKDIFLDVTFLDSTLENDLKRRDFTMNAIAFNLASDTLIDPLNGFDDIKNGLIRYPGKKTIKDDPLRMLKAIRHFSFLNGFVIHHEIIETIRELKHLIRETAPERIKYEMDQILVSPEPYAGLKAMEETGLLFEIFPELQSLRQLDIEKKFTLETYGHTIDGFRYINKYNEIYRLDAKHLRNVGYALLFHDLGKAFTFSYDESKKVVHFFYHERFSNEIASNIMERLRFSSHEMKTVNALIDSHMRIFLISNIESTDKAARRLSYKMGELTPSLALLTICDMYGSSGGEDNPSTERVHNKCYELIRAYEEWKRKPLPKLINGNDLIALGFPEGPLIGKILNDISKKQIAGKINNEEEAISHALGFLKISPRGESE